MPADLAIRFRVGALRRGTDVHPLDADLWIDPGGKGEAGGDATVVRAIETYDPHRVIGPVGIDDPVAIAGE